MVTARASTTLRLRGGAVIRRCETRRNLPQDIGLSDHAFIADGSVVLGFAFGRIKGLEVPCFVCGNICVNKNLPISTPPMPRSGKRHQYGLRNPNSRALPLLAKNSMKPSPVAPATDRCKCAKRIQAVVRTIHVADIAATKQLLEQIIFSSQNQTRTLSGVAGDSIWKVATRAWDLMRVEVKFHCNSKFVAIHPRDDSFPFAEVGPPFLALWRNAAKVAVSAECHSTVRDEQKHFRLAMVDLAALKVPILKSCQEFWRRFLVSEDVSRDDDFPQACQ